MIATETRVFLSPLRAKQVSSSWMYQLAKSCYRGLENQEMVLQSNTNPTTMTVKNPQIIVGTPLLYRGENALALEK